MLGLPTLALTRARWVCICRIIFLAGASNNHQGGGGGGFGLHQGGGVEKKFLIPGYNVIFAGEARDPHPLRKFFGDTFTQNFL